MPLPFDFEGKGVSDFVSVSSSSNPFLSSNLPLLCKWNNTGEGGGEGWFVGGEPTSVLDTFGSPSPPTSTSTLSSSLGGGDGYVDTAGVAAVSGNPSHKWPPARQETSSSNVGVESGCASSELQPVLPPVGISGGATTEKCEDWENMLSESAAASPSQEQSILRWIMGDMDDSSMGLNKLLQSGAPTPEFDFNSGFGVVDQGYGFDLGSSGGNLMNTVNPSLPNSGFSQNTATNKLNHEKLDFAPNPPNYKLPNSSNPMFFPSPNNLLPMSLSPAAFNHPPGSSEVKPHVFNPQLQINQHQAQHTQNPSFFLPLQNDQQHIQPPPAKRHNPGGFDFDPAMLQHQAQGVSPQLQLLPQFLQQRPGMVGMKPKIAGDETGHQQQAVIDQLFKAAELVQTGNSVLAQGILARLNHQLSPIGKPFHRAAFFCKEALQSLLHNVNPSATTTTTAAVSPFNLILKIGAYKSFSEISPLLQFANFTCNQAILESLQGFDRIHIVDFDIGYGGQWASLMQELALRTTGAPSLKITAFAQEDHLELSLTRENLTQFAHEINMVFEFQALSFDALHSTPWSLPFHASENEAIAVNLPVSYQLPLPLILGFIKQLSPKIVVSVDRGCDRTDLPFPNHIIHALQSYSNLLESLDAVNVNLDALQKIERFLIQPGFEKIVTGRYRSPEKTPHWRSLFLSSGLIPITFSNFTESQAECVVKRTPVRGFHVEKRQSSLVLCWQRKELVSASAWRC